VSSGVKARPDGAAFASRQIRVHMVRHLFPEYLPVDNNLVRLVPKCHRRRMFFVRLRCCRHTKIIQKRGKKWWVRPSQQSRKIANRSRLLNELREDDELIFELRGSFHNFLRMSSSDFEYISCKIEPIIKKSDTFMRQAIPVQERLAVTLRFLATGDSYMSLSYLFKMSKQSILEMVPEVCTAIIDVLKEFIKVSQIYYIL